MVPAASRNTGPAPSMGQESLTASWMRSMPPATLGSETSISQRSSSSPPVKARVAPELTVVALVVPRPALLRTSRVPASTAVVPV